MIAIDPDDGAVRIELPHGEAVVLEGLSPDAPIERGTQRALFLEPAESETLLKMVDYVLQSVRIRAESADALRAVRPRLEQLVSGTPGV